MAIVITNRQRPFRVLTNVLVLFACLSGCTWSSEDPTTSEVDSKVNSPPIVRYDGEMSRVVSLVYTTSEKLALTFNGMGERQTMMRLLDELDRYQVKATFFLPGIRVAEEPDIAQEILARGHEIENQTLERSDPDTLDYAQIYTSIQLTNDIFMEKTGVTPRYVRTTFGNYNDDLRLAVADLGLKAVVTYTLNLNASVLEEWIKGTAEQKMRFLNKYINRGGVIALETTNDQSQVIEALSYLVQAAEEAGYDLVPLSELFRYEYERKSLEQIAGYDAAQMNHDTETVAFDLIQRIENEENEVFLTFDDWASDYTVTKILNILDTYDVTATFFLKANGPASNPNLAKAIVEAGHDVANHTYSHPIITKLTTEEIQEEVIRAHQTLTEAIQQQPLLWFRPPTGAIDDRSARAVAATGYRQIVMYDVTTFDWDNQNDAEDITNGVIEQTQNGSIILLHILDDTHTVEALPAIIEELRNRGFTFGRLAERIGH